MTSLWMHHVNIYSTSDITGSQASYNMLHGWSYSQLINREPVMSLEMWQINTQGTSLWLHHCNLYEPSKPVTSLFSDISALESSMSLIVLTCCSCIHLIGQFFFAMEKTHHTLFCGSHHKAKQEHKFLAPFFPNAGTNPTTNTDRKYISSVGECPPQTSVFRPLSFLYQPI